MPSKLLKVPEVADRFGVTEATIRAWLLRSKISSYKVGRSVRIASEEIDKILIDGLKPARRPLKNKEER